MLIPPVHMYVSPSLVFSSDTNWVRCRVFVFVLVSLTSPVRPRSEPPHSILAPPETSSSADSTNHQPAYWGAGLHHQTANPERKAEQLQYFWHFWYFVIGWLSLSVNAVCVCAHHHGNAVFLQQCFIIGDVTNSNNCVGIEALQVLKGW